MNARALVGYGITVLLIAAGIAWLARHWEEIGPFLTVRPQYFAVLLPLAVLAVLLIGLMNQVIVSALGAPLAPMEWVSLGFASTLANHILPMRAGAALRATYYRDRSSLPISRFAAGMAVAYLITVVVNTALGAAVLPFSGAGSGAGGRVLLASFLAAGALCLLVINLPVKPAAFVRLRRLAELAARLHRGWDTLRRDHILLFRAGALALAGTAISAMRLRVAFWSLGHTVSSADCLLIAVIAALSMFISVTPAALGFREAAIAASSAAIGVSAEVGLLAGSLDRAASLLVIGSLGPLATLRLSIGLSQRSGSS